MGSLDRHMHSMSIRQNRFRLMIRSTRLIYDIQNDWIINQIFNKGNDYVIINSNHYVISTITLFQPLRYSNHNVIPNITLFQPLRDIYQSWSLKRPTEQRIYDKGLSAPGEALRDASKPAIPDPLEMPYPDVTRFKPYEDCFHMIILSDWYRLVLFRRFC